MPQNTKFVYSFDEGNRDLKDLLGGKGANLAEMTKIGLPVPPGFTITTEACKVYLNSGAEPQDLAGQVTEQLDKLEQAIGRQLGDSADPLLVSVRSGAKFSMPGMMDTVLNIGLNDDSVQGLAKQSGNERFAWDSYRRLVQMFGRTVLGVEGEHFEHAIDDIKTAKGVTNDLDLDSAALQQLVDTFKGIVAKYAERPFPTDTREQLDLAIHAVFDSWNGDRARLYRRQERIPADLGTGSTSRRWSSATWAWTPAPASRSPATRALALPVPTATTSRTRRAKTSSPASATLARCTTSSRSTSRRTTS